MVADKKKTSEHLEGYRKLDRFKNDRHDANARAAVTPGPETPRINTDNL
ncbi:hypothetical protein [Bacillus sp. OK048]|nr:hypothetical protein [Bacillus sp. OK048]SDM64721.1 hypothetical protein SAMN05443253_104389 [Bacillus sp. OK048]